MTNKIETTFPIYSSQLTQFKTKAKEISWALYSSKLLNSELSNFKSNDALARALGYKSHSDLIFQTKAKLQADHTKPFTLYSDKAVTQSIATSFWKEFGRAKESHALFQNVFNYLRNQEKNVANQPCDGLRMYIEISLNNNGIHFVNTTRIYFLDLDWQSSINIGNTFGFSGKDELISLLEQYEDKPLLIEGIEEKDEYLPGEALLKKLKNFPGPLLRSLYYEAERQNREFIDSLPQNKRKKNFLDELLV